MQKIENLKYKLNSMLMLSDGFCHSAGKAFKRGSTSTARVLL